MDLSKRCRKALVLQHEIGHAVPMLDAGLKREILSALNGLGNDAPSIPPPEPAANARSCDEVEMLLTGHESVENAVVVTHPDPVSGGQRVGAFIVLDQYAATPAPDLKAYLKTQFPDHQRIPKAAQPYASPRTRLEQEMAKIWQRILMMDHEPGIDDDFFQLGGYSLLSMILLREIEGHLGRKLPTKVLLHLSTIRRLAETLESSHRAEDQSRLDPTTIDYLNDSGLPLDHLHGLLAHTGAWVGKRLRAESLVFGMNTDARARPLFWCCQGFNELSQLAKHLGSGHLVMDNSQANIESLANYYACEILAVQAEGPFIVGGNCQSAKIAFQVARRLLEKGHRVALLCLQEQVVPLRYSGRVALFMGDESGRNPAKYFEHPEQSWQPFYDGAVSVSIIAGAHAQFFKEPNIQTLAAQIQRQIKIAKADTSAGREVDASLPVPILPAAARRAMIQAPRRLFVTPASDASLGCGGWAFFLLHREAASSHPG